MSLSDCPRCWETPCACQNTDDTDGWIRATLPQQERGEPDNSVRDGDKTPVKQTVKEVAAQSARHAIDGAIEYGRQGINPPATADHWLAQYWRIGEQLSELDSLTKYVQERGDYEETFPIPSNSGELASSVREQDNMHTNPQKVDTSETLLQISGKSIHVREQKPVAWRLRKAGLELGITSYDREQVDSYLQDGWKIVQELYAAPPDAQAIRQAALEEAFQMCIEHADTHFDNELFNERAAAIGCAYGIRALIGKTEDTK